VRRTWLYAVIEALVNMVCLTAFRARVRGRERIPARGGVLIVANHQSFLDIPLVAVAARRHVAFVARDSLARVAWLGFVMRRCGAILVRRERADRRALEDMVAHLAAGDAVAIFPEGTRTRDGRVAPFRGGFQLVARRAGVPILPAGIQGTYHAWPRSRKLPRLRRICLSFGEPVDPASADAPERVRASILRLVGEGGPATSTSEEAVRSVDPDPPIDP
jgi:1-acyl-sn-glycerol-3-phosphate acyltransferase